MQAVNSLGKQGILAAEQRQVDEIQTFMMPSTNGTIHQVSIPTIRTLGSNKNGLFRSIVGETWCAKYPTLIITRRPEATLDSMVMEFRKLPWLKSIFFNPGIEMGEDTLKQLKREFPSVEFNVHQVVKEDLTETK